MTCTRCGRDVPEGTTTCECGAEIEAPGRTSLVRVHDCLGLNDAQEIARALDLAEIPYYLNNENMAALFPGAMGGVSAGGLGRVAIMVAPEDAARARETIRDVLEGR